MSAHHRPEHHDHPHLTMTPAQRTALADTMTSRRVAANVRLHLGVRAGWDVLRLDQAMCDHGWGGAFWQASSDARDGIHGDPVHALHQLLADERNLVPGEDQALATALNVPLAHLHVVPHTDRATRRRSLLARLLGGRR